MISVQDKTSWSQGLVRKASSYEQNLETGSMNIEVACLMWADSGYSGLKVVSSVSESAGLSRHVDRFPGLVEV